ncbi:extensin family protein [Caulobacter mirabilis]|uniref:Extensin n=1 Tax=Caulobacter mirabilis TaxID=69666 RepID=A0A2D2ATI0_9CAUL|nr:extensin family protein [Caulobacter mirabilis]ATQ41314.1 extensin [Caulobacter mirabilis]
MAGYRVPRPDQPQIERRAARQTLVARIVGFTLLWGIVGVLAFAADRAIPREHLPWKPLALVDPVGMATKIKAARSGADPKACRAVLYNGGVEFSEVAPRVSGFCAVHDALTIEAGLAPLKPDGAEMTCKQALAVSIWERQVVQPAAFDLFGQGVVRIDHYGAFACRRMYGREDTPVSEHAAANALDVAAFRLADGTVIAVAADWSDPGPKGKFLHRVRDGACQVFLTTLSPDYNDAHRDHFHLDMGGQAKCG